MLELLILQRVQTVSIHIHTILFSASASSTKLFLSLLRQSSTLPLAMNGITIQGIAKATAQFMNWQHKFIRKQHISKLPHQLYTGAHHITLPSEDIYHPEYSLGTSISQETSCWCHPSSNGSSYTSSARPKSATLITPLASILQISHSSLWWSES